MDMKKSQKYWATVHYPPEKGKAQSWDIFLKEEDLDILQEISPGDHVVIYEARSGGDYYGENGEIVKHDQGREGVVFISEVSGTGKRRPNNRPIKYVDGRVKNWSWTIECLIVNSSGYLSRRDFLKSIGHSENFTLRGFGKKHSGLKEISKEQFDAIYTQYKKNMKPLPESLENVYGKFSGSLDRGEGNEHKRLKEAVFSEPERLLGESGLKGYRLEFGYGTGDRADIILTDVMERPIAVEVEVVVKKENIAGLLQAVKYKYMFAVVAEKEFEEVRSFLVAYEIEEDVQMICGKYGVECFEVKRSELQR